MITMRNPKTNQEQVLAERETVKKRILLDAGWQEVANEEPSPAEKTPDSESHKEQEGPVLPQPEVFVVDNNAQDDTPSPLVPEPQQPDMKAEPIVITEQDKNDLDALVREAPHADETTPEVVQEKRKAKGRKAGSKQGPVHTWMGNLPDKESE